MTNEDFSNKYRHIGFSYPAVPDGWKTIVKHTIVQLEREMWPRWMPMGLKHLIYDLGGYGNNDLQDRWWYPILRPPFRWLHRKVRQGAIMDIKEKYGGLRIDIGGTEEAFLIVDKADLLAACVCQKCSSTDDVRTFEIRGWISNLCQHCREKMMNKEEPFT